MGAHQSRAGSAPNPKGNSNRFSRNLKRHSGIDKLASVFKSLTPGPNNSQGTSPQEAKENATESRHAVTPEQREEMAGSKLKPGSATPTSLTAALGAGTAVSPATPVSLGTYEFVYLSTALSSDDDMTITSGVIRRATKLITLLSHSIILTSFPVSCLHLPKKRLPDASSHRSLLGAFPAFLLFPFQLTDFA